MGRSRRGIAALVGILAASTAVAPAASAQTDDPTKWIVDRPRFEPIDPTPLTVDGVGDYRGSVEIVRRSGTKVDIVNHVTVEDYLKGISEVPAAWPLEAQKAQAIAARTYALYEAARQEDPTEADLCATDSCQVYAGLAKERREGGQAWVAAVAQTKHQVLLHQDRPINAKYSSSNGGETIQGGQPYLRGGIADPDDARSPLHRWRASYPVADIARITQLAAEPIALTRQDTDLVATHLDGDGNPIGERITVEDFRDRVNAGFATPSGLPLPVPSRRFDVQVDSGLVHIDGRGWGHGIGLSQYGALGKALRGMKAPDILAAYYAGIRPTTLPADRIPPQLKISVATDKPEQTITNATGRFRVVDGSGRVLAHSASGTWKASPAPDGRIQLTPPTEQQGLPAASIATLDPPQPVAGRPVNVSVSLDGPGALTAIGLTRPDGTIQVVDEQRLRHPGPVLVRLTTSAQPGTYHLDLERDAGNGRVHTTTLTVEVAGTDGSTTTEPGSDDTDRPGDRATVDESTTLDLAFAGAESLERAPIPTRILQATATFMLLAVVVLGAFWVGRRPGSELH
ncbi:MAG TPA: SpoIID/LytB domain-containing protein [Acidimicrobiales bacterium]|nr:SpoIID/LytB domain-containing protein [Acidimicrobiales bacterium]